eukprot:scaffold421377_cov55-Attheya_sp.AAC.8
MEKNKVASIINDNEQSVIMDSNDACVESSGFYTSSVMWKNIHMFDRTPEAGKRSQGPGSNLSSMVSSSSDSDNIFVPSPNYSTIGETGSDDNSADFVSVVSRAHIFGGVKKNGFSTPKWNTVETQLPTLSAAQNTTTKATSKSSPHFTNTRAKFELSEKLPSGALSRETKGPSRTFSFDSSEEGRENNANIANVGAGYEGKVYTPRNNVTQYTNARARFESPEKLPPVASKRSTNTQNADKKRENCTTTLEVKSQSDRESRSLQPVSTNDIVLPGTTSSSKNIVFDENGSPLVMTPRTAVLRAAGLYDSPTIKDTERDRPYLHGSSSKTQRYKDHDFSIENSIQCPSPLKATVHNDDSVCSNLQQELERLNIKLSNRNENLLFAEDDSSGPVSNLSKLPNSRNISCSIPKLNSAVKSTTHLHSTNASTNAIDAPLHIQTYKSVGPRVEEMINRLSTPQQRALRRSRDMDKSSTSDSKDKKDTQQGIEPKMDVHPISDSLNENTLHQIHSQPPSYDRASSIGDLKRNRRIKRTVRNAREGAMVRKLKERLWLGDEWLVSEVRPAERNDIQSETQSAESFQISPTKFHSSNNTENGMNSSNADHMNMQDEKGKEVTLQLENCNDQEASTTTSNMENRQVEFIKLLARVEPNEKDSTDYGSICVSQESSMVPIMESREKSHVRNAASCSEPPALIVSDIASRSHLESISSIAQSPHKFPKTGLLRTPLSALPPKSPGMKAKLEGGDPASRSVTQAPRRYEPIRVPSPRKASAILRVSPREHSPSNAFIITSSQPGLSKELLADNLYGANSDDASSSSCCSPTSTVGSQSYDSDEKSDMRNESNESIESVSPRHTNETPYDTEHVTSEEDEMKEAKQPTAMKDSSPGIHESGESVVKVQKMDVPEKTVHLHDEVEREMIKEEFAKHSPSVHRTEDWVEEEFRINESHYKEEEENTDAFVLRDTVSKGLFQKRIRVPKADRAKHGKPTTTVSQLLQRKQLEVALSKCDADNDASPKTSAKTGKHLWKRNRSKVTKRRVRFFR